MTSSLTVDADMLSAHSPPLLMIMNFCFAMNY